MYVLETDAPIKIMLETESIVTEDLILISSASFSNLFYAIVKLHFKNEVTCSEKSCISDQSFLLHLTVFIIVTSVL